MLLQESNQQNRLCLKETRINNVTAPLLFEVINYHKESIKKDQQSVCLIPETDQLIVFVFLCLKGHSDLTEHSVCRYSTILLR